MVVVEALAVLVSVDAPPDDDPCPPPCDPSCGLVPGVTVPDFLTWLGEWFGRSDPVASADVVVGACPIDAGSGVDVPAAAAASGGGEADHCHEQRAAQCKRIAAHSRRLASSMR